MLTKVISGGQSGADQAAWRAARRFSIPTGGWVPKGFLTEDGPRPEFATLYGAREHESPDYPPRTRANVAAADALLWCGDERSPGGKLTIRLARERRLPIFHCSLAGFPHPLCDWLIRWDVQSLLVAGNRESKAPGIGAWVEAYLCEVFRLLGHKEVSG